MSRPLLVVSDVAARLVRRGLLDPTDPSLPRWRETRVLVFAHGPVVYESPRVEREVAEKSLPAYVTAAPWCPPLPSIRYSSTTR